MYIFKNAFRCIARAKGRNILIGIVVLLLSVSSCIGLSIKQANRSLKKEYTESMEISATLNPKDMRKSGSISLETMTELAQSNAVKDFYYSTSVYFAAGDGIEPLDVAGSFRQNKDFRKEYGDIKSGDSTSSTTTTVENTAATTTVKPINLAEEIEIPTESTHDTSSESGTSSEAPSQNDTPSDNNDATEEKPNQNDNSGTESMPQRPSTDSDSNQGGGNRVPNFPSDMPSDGSQNGGNGSNMPGGFRGGDTHITNNYYFNMASMNDFTVVGYSSTAAIPDYVAALNVLDNESEELNCVISKNLAEENEMAVGDTFTLKNPNNEDETYTFTVAGICDTSQSSDTQDTAANASFSDNYIHVGRAAIEKILADSAEANPEEEKDDSDEDEKSKVLTATHSGTFIFANLTDYNRFGDSLSEDYTLVSEDVSNYEQSVSQLETLGKYASYFLIVIFVIGAFVLVIINLFSIRNRKYEVGVLTAIGMKKYKVALQFVIELFVITFIALTVGSAVGAATSVPVTNSLLTTVNQEEQTVSQEKSTASANNGFTPPDMPGSESDRAQFKGNRPTQFGGKVNNYVAQVKSATDMTVILQMILVGLGLTLFSSAASIAFVMRYEPLKILNNRD